MYGTVELVGVQAVIYQISHPATPVPVGQWASGAGRQAGRGLTGG
jgi:hypothetical protein